MASSYAPAKWTATHVCNTLLCGAVDRRGAPMIRRVMAAALLTAILGIGAHRAAAQQIERDPVLILVTGPATPSKSPDSLSPEEKMQRRYPQPVRVGDLIGLPVLDDDDRTLGRVRNLVRTAAGKVQLIVPY